MVNDQWEVILAMMIIFLSVRSSGV